MVDPHESEQNAGIASAEEGQVMLDGPDGVAVTMSPDAAAGTAESLIAAAEAARGQRDDEAGDEDA
jgi:hypothetical protein